ncbi:ankyrin repeat domain-containing protein [Burkholderia pseudomallei]|uniref:ankyrin repeat domain-containing protein n=1 Tax=Burkholderia pseudomallei TaxID=28450 RepID=UPI000F073128|nr:ankyrin repeat domain-containing protein [Burkholderia pseudomallei]CAJ3076746.1 ankyrin [Burkholderia pseudomallei]VCK72501.1 ankyrin [Burkholderia pseudomallei]VCK79853.1 ankyrin [Burkholderia pseudomallei]VCK80150.1 ankyrin [Burkholderia pseudomallei]VCK80659.1 ankyrin [Burkholderia pseudomallei]
MATPNPNEWRDEEPIDLPLAVMGAASIAPEPQAEPTPVEGLVEHARFAGQPSEFDVRERPGSNNRIANLDGDLDDALVGAAERGELDRVRQAMAQGANARAVDGLGRTALMRAARQGHAQVVRELLPVSDPAARCDERGKTALMMAAEWGHAECVRELLPHSAEVPDYHGRTPLMSAARQGHAQVLRELLPVSDPNTRHRDDGKTALIMAAERGHVECVRTLLPHSDANRRGWSGQNALWAVIDARQPEPGLGLAKPPVSPVDYGRLECIRLLAPHTSDRVCRGEDAIVLAARRSDLDLLRALLPMHPRQADEAAIANGEGMERVIGEAFADAIGYGGPESECVNLLAAHCTPATADKDGVTPLAWAAHQGAADLLLELLPHSDPRAATIRGGPFQAGGTTALMAAARKGHAECVKALLPLSDANAKNSDGCNALMTAVRPHSFASPQARLDCVRLLAPQTRVLDRDEMGRTALMSAAELNDVDCLKALLAYGGAEMTNVGGRTALIEAAQKGNAEAVQTLLPFSDPAIKDTANRTALDWAIEADSAECADLLGAHSSTPAAARDKVLEHFHHEKVRRTFARVEAFELAIEAREAMEAASRVAPEQSAPKMPGDEATPVARSESQQSTMGEALARRARFAGGTAASTSATVAKPVPRRGMRL